MTRSRLILLLAVLPGMAAAQRQQSPALPSGAASITTADVRRRINIIADDSMLGRARAAQTSQGTGWSEPGAAPVADRSTCIAG